MTPRESQEYKIPKFEPEEFWYTGSNTKVRMHKVYNSKHHYERIKILITENQKNLSENEYLHVEAVLNDNSRIHVHSLGYYNTVIITIKGVDSDGNEVIAVLPQHNTQILITKKKVPSGKEKPAIAFHDNGG